MNTVTIVGEAAHVVSGDDWHSWLFMFGLIVACWVAALLATAALFSPPTARARTRLAKWSPTTRSNFEVLTAVVGLVPERTPCGCCPGNEFGWRSSRTTPADQSCTAARPITRTSE